jgi:hypothetical protein
MDNLPSSSVFVLLLHSFSVLDFSAKLARFWLTFAAK